MSTNPRRTTAAGKYQPHIVVSGDVLRDVHLYEGERSNPHEDGRRPTMLRESPGGALLLHNILAKLTAHEKREKGKSAHQIHPGLQLGFDLQKPNDDPSVTVMESFGIWRPFPIAKDSQQKVWRLERPLGYGQLSIKRAEADLTMPDHSKGELTGSGSVLVIDDAGLGFRNKQAKPVWPPAVRDRTAAPPEWIVLKMSSPLATGDLWQQLCTPIRSGEASAQDGGTPARDGETLADRTVLVACIGDIRNEPVRVTQAVSWERSALDLVYELAYNPKLKPLLKCRHCVINFRCEGALHIFRLNDGSNGCRLIFDPANLEGDWGADVEGQAFGYMSCLTAAIVTRLIRIPLAVKADESNAGENIVNSLIEEGIAAGLSSMRELRRLGHGDVGKAEPGIPYDLLAKNILKPNASFSTQSVSLPPGVTATKTKQLDTWTFMGSGLVLSKSARPALYAVGRRVARRGPQELGNIPYQRFGALFTVDRSEIESLRNLQYLIRRYEQGDEGKKPLSIAVFGAPGSGKSFSVKQIGKAVLGKNVPILEFNLSQFHDTHDLVGAFHMVRDKVLEGKTPIVFWDEFDSESIRWLRSLLAPMQDGAFRDQETVHPIGKCIFVFAGGTSYDVANFGPDKNDPLQAEAYADFVLKKGPDFKSRLSGHLNVLGPNRRQIKAGEWSDDTSDVFFPVRRALMIRALLGLTGHRENDELTIDDSVLSALIEIDRYHHGSRSMEKILKLFKDHGEPDSIRRSDVPPADLISIHVDYDSFLTRVNQMEVAMLADELAPALHEAYRKSAADIDPNYDVPFDELSFEAQEDNRAAAARIPEVLAQAGLCLVPGNSPDAATKDDVMARIDDNIGVLAEAEHDGWMEFRLSNGWKYGPVRNNEERVHHLLMPYSKLPNIEKNKDRKAVREYPEKLAAVGYKIGFVPETRGTLLEQPPG